MRNLPVHYQNNDVSQHQNLDYIVLPDFEDQKEQGFLDYIKVIKKRKLLFISPAIIIIPLAVFYLSSQRPIYEAQTTLLIKQDENNLLSIRGSDINSIQGGDYLNTQYEIIKSRPIAELVVKKLELHERPLPQETAFETKTRQAKELIKSSIESLTTIWSNPRQNNKTKDSIPDGSDIELETAITNLQDSIVVLPRPETQLVDIFVQSYNPKDAATQANTVANTYLEQNLQDRLSQSNNAINWLEAREKSLRNKINQTENSIQDLRKKIES